MDHPALPEDLLAHVELLAEAAEAEDGAAPLDEATWLALRHDSAAQPAWWRATDGVALLIGAELTLLVHPQGRGRGTGTQLLHEVAADGVEEELRAWSHGDHPGARALAAHAGFEPVRELWVMRLEHTGDLPPLEMPEATSLRAYTDDDAEELLAVNAAAFTHHPEQGSLDAAGLAVRQREPWWEPAGLLLAHDTDTRELLGFHWTKRHTTTAGEVYVVGVSPGAQGRGLGRALTLAGLHHLADGGATSVLLYVEADNHPAVAVYRRLGFEVAQSHVQYAGTLPTAAAPGPG